MKGLREVSEGCFGTLVTVLLLVHEIAFIFIIALFVVILLPGTVDLLDAARVSARTKSTASLTAALLKDGTIKAINAFKLCSIDKLGCNCGATTSLLSLLSSSCCPSETFVELSPIVHFQVLADVSNNLLEVRAIKVQKDAWLAA
jgi:hypothetical protein